MLLLDKMILSKFVHPPMDGGMAPSIELRSAMNNRNLVQFPTPDAIEVKEFSLTNTCSSEQLPRNSGGKGPDNEFFERDQYFNLTKLPNSVGTDPERSFCPMRLQKEGCTGWTGRECKGSGKSGVLLPCSAHANISRDFQVVN